MSCQTVPSGVYFGFTLAQMLAELDRYKAAVTASTFGAGHVISASENGSSFAFGASSDMSLAQWQQEIQRALHYLDPCAYPVNVSSTRVAVIR
jgi:nucleoside permease NupC